MPRYDVTLDTPTTIKGTLVEVPPVGGLANGDTAHNVYMTEEQADFLATNPHLTIKKLPVEKAESVVSKMAKAKTFEELDDLALGDDRDAVARAVTDRRIELSGGATEPEPAAEGGES